MVIEEIKAYKIGDLMFKSRREAAEFASKNELTSKLRKILERLESNEEGQVGSRDNVLDFLIDYRQQIYSALHEACRFVEANAES